MSAIGGKADIPSPHRIAISQQASKDLDCGDPKRARAAGTLMAWGRFCIAADFHDAFR